MILRNQYLSKHMILFISQTHLTFGREFTEAVELKQVAQQDAERARFVVEKVSGTCFMKTSMLMETTLLQPPPKQTLSKDWLQFDKLKLI